MKTGLASTGTVGALLLAHLPCCGLNIALVAGGAGGGLGFLHWLEPYRAAFVVFSLVMAAITLWLAFRPHRKCAHHECHHNDRPAMFWRRGAAVAVALIAVAGIFVNPAAHEDHDHSHEIVLH